MCAPANGMKAAAVENERQPFLTMKVRHYEEPYVIG
jgi:hypothetical protein